MKRLLLIGCLLTSGCSAESIGLAAALVQAVPNINIRQTVVNAAPTPSPGAMNPIIQSLSPNPSSVARKGDALTFTVVAFAPDGAILDYTWTATKGTLSATKGQAVSWTPQRSDGSLEAGTAVVQVLITNGKGGVATGSVNLTIGADGSASTNQATLPTAPAAPAAPAATAGPVLAPVSVAPATGGGGSLVFDSFTFMSYTDPVTGQIQDNGDKLIQPGEKVLLMPGIKNVGSARVDGILLHMESSDPYVTVQDMGTSAQDYKVEIAGIDPGDTQVVRQYAGPLAQYAKPTGFLMSVAKECPAGEVAKLTIKASDRFGNKWSLPFTATIQKGPGS